MNIQANLKYKLKSRLKKKIEIRNLPIKFKEQEKLLLSFQNRTAQ